VWVDVLNCDRKLQPFGYLVWAACGKDPGYNPRSLLAAASRLHYSQAEVDTLDFGGESPDAAALGKRWHTILATAGEICGLLPAKRVGTCIATKEGILFQGDPAALAKALQEHAIMYHEGRIGGSWPQVVARK
jgi:hypothetical protein